MKLSAAEKTEQVMDECLQTDLVIHLMNKRIYKLKQQSIGWISASVNWQACPSGGQVFL